MAFLLKSIWSLSTAKELSAILNHVAVSGHVMKCHSVKESRLS